ncbi:MAG: hypothetical protein ILP02_05080, partial [Clostridia bacterium]|nr:hypothetical protein [Clostridia bacterium]
RGTSRFLYNKNLYITGLHAPRRRRKKRLPERRFFFLNGFLPAFRAEKTHSAGKRDFFAVLCATMTGKGRMP